MVKLNTVTFTEVTACQAGVSIRAPGRSHNSCFVEPILERQLWKHADDTGQSVVTASGKAPVTVHPFTRQ